MSRYEPQETHEKLLEVTKHLKPGEFLAALMAVVCKKEGFFKSGTITIEAELEDLAPLGIPGGLKIDEVTVSFEPAKSTEDKRTHFDA